MFRSFFQYCLFCVFLNLIMSNSNVIKLGVGNIDNLGNGEYLIDIYAKNNLPIAGVQFDILGEKFEDRGNGRWDTGEDFKDINGNNKWDNGEPFMDKANNKWDEGEPFIDSNKNGRYDSELFTILDVKGGRAGENGFDFRFGKDKGVILSFSMKGDTVEPINTKNKGTLTLLSVKLKKINSTPSEFNMHSIVAGKKGVKLDSYFVPIMIK